MIAKSWAVLCRGMLILACLILFATAAALFLRVPHIALILAAILAWRHCRRRFGSGWVHGTAKTAGWQDLMADDLLGDTGHILGTTAYLDPPSKPFALGQLLAAPLGRSALAVRLLFASFGGRRSGGESLIRANDSVHLATFSKTGGGKGVSVVIPTLLSHAGSMVVTDTKTENFQKSARHRKRKFGHRIVKLEPFGTDSDTFNPLDLIDHESPDFIDQTRDLAAAMVLRTGKETETHWLDSAERVLQAIIALVCACPDAPEYRNLQSVREILASRAKFQGAVKLMQESGEVAGGMLERLGHSLTWHQDRELASILSTVQRATGWLDSPLIAANTAYSSFDPRDLHTGKMTIYLCLPPERLKSHAALQRLWISSILRAITPGADERNKVLFMLDEVGNMGHLQILEDAVTLYRGMGIRLWFIFQSLGQVKECFGDHADTFLDNIGTQQYFRVQAYETAEAISRRIGDATVTAASKQDGTTDSRPDGSPAREPQAGSRSRSTSLTLSEVSRRLLKPEEIIGLRKDACIVLHNATPPIIARLVRYYDAPIFRRGRIGRSPGLGLAGGFAAAAALLASLAVAAFVTVLPMLRLPQNDGSAPSLGQPAAYARGFTGQPSRPIVGRLPNR